MHAVGQCDTPSKGVLSLAQQEAEARGGKFLVSGFILLAAVSRGDEISKRLVSAIGAAPDAIAGAVEAEWQSASQHRQDVPATLVNQGINEVVNAQPITGRSMVERLIAVMLAHETSMASRVLGRLGIAPQDVAHRLNTPA